jgi:uncharacterized membrane protein YhaH (DUF805 family)
MALGRISRQVYWIMVGVLIGLTVLAASVPELEFISRGVSVVWLFAWMPRLHDIGKSAWYVALPLAAAVAIAAFGFFAYGDSFARIVSGDTEGFADDDPAVLNAGIIILVLLAIHIGFTLWLGFARGDARANRFGEAPKF